MKKVWIYAAALATIAVIGGIYLASGNRSQPPATGSNVFTGRIVSGNLAPQTYSNLSVLTDRGCTTDPRTGLSNCTSTMQTRNGTIIAFNYEHDMMIKPCLSAGDVADVRVLANGTAIVDRTYWNGGGL